MDNKLSIQIEEDVKPVVKAFFDEDTGSFSYVVKDPESQSCAIIDSVMDFDYPSGAVSYDEMQRIV